MITEDYVSFETAKLLKEKGFDGICRAGYTSFGNLHDIEIKSYLTNKTCPDTYWECVAPTHQNAMRWLREVHKLNVEVYRTACGYVGCVVSIPSGTDIKFLEDDGDDLPSGQYTTYEKACEATIRYCLDNLI
jgi:hypothetical protein